MELLLLSLQEGQMKKILTFHFHFTGLEERNLIVSSITKKDGTVLYSRKKFSANRQIFQKMKIKPQQQLSKPKISKPKSVIISKESTYAVQASSKKFIETYFPSQPTTHPTMTQKSTSEMTESKSPVASQPTTHPTMTQKSTSEMTESKSPVVTLIPNVQELIDSKSDLTLIPNVQELIDSKSDLTLIPNVQELSLDSLDLNNSKPTFETQFPFKIFTGNEYSEDETILEQQFSNNIYESIKNSSYNKLIALESVFSFILKYHCSFSELITVLYDSAKKVRQAHMKTIKNKKKYGEESWMTQRDLTKETEKSGRHLNSFIHELGSNIIQFLTNCEDYLRNDDPSVLSFQCPFVVHLSTNEMRNLMQPTVLEKLKNSVTREDVLMMRLWTPGFISVKENLVQVVSTNDWKAFEEKDVERMKAVAHAAGFFQLDKTLEHPKFLEKLEEYFSSKNPFKSKNPALAQFVQDQQVASMKTNNKRKKPPSPYENLRTEEANLLKSTKKACIRTNNPKQNCSSRFLDEEESICSLFHQNEDGSHSSDILKVDPFSSSASSVNSLTDPELSISMDRGKYSDPKLTMSMDRETASDPELSMSMGKKKGRKLLLFEQLINAWNELKGVIDGPPVEALDKAMQTVKQVIQDSHEDGVVDDASEIIDLTRPKVQTVKQVIQDSHEDVVVDDASDIIDLTRPKVQPVISLSTLECSSNRLFLDGRYNLEGLLVPFSGALEQNSDLDVLFNRIQYCAYMVYIRILAALFYDKQKVLQEGAERFHYAQLRMLVESTKDYSLKNREHCSDPFKQTIQFISVATKQKVILDLSFNDLENKSTFQERVQQKWKIRRTEAKTSGLTLDLCVIYVAFAHALDTSSSSSSSSSSSWHVPLHLEVKDSSKVTLKYQLCTVVYGASADSDEVVFSVVEAIRDVNMFQHSVYNVSTTNIPTTPTYVRSSYVLPGTKSKQLRSHAFPGIHQSERGNSLSAIGSFWYRTESNVQFNEHRSDIECLPSTHFDTGIFKVQTDDLIERLLNPKGWLNSTLVEVFVAKTFEYFYDCRNIESSYLLDKYTLTGYKGCTSFFKKYRADGKSIFDSGNVLHLTVNYPKNMHWLYCYVVFSQKVIILVDSMNNGSGDNITNIVLNFLEEEYNTNHSVNGCLFDRKEWMRVYDQHTPCQEDDVGCGLFLILNVMRVAKKITAAKELVKKTSCNGLVGPSWKRNFSHMEKFKIRQLMCSIIREDFDISTLLPYIVGDGEKDETVQKRSVVEEEEVCNKAVEEEEVCNKAVEEEEVCNKAVGDKEVVPSEIVSSQASSVVVVRATRRKSNRKK